MARHTCKPIPRLAHSCATDDGDMTVIYQNWGVEVHNTAIAHLAGLQRCCRSSLTCSSSGGRYVHLLHRRNPRMVKRCKSRTTDRLMGAVAHRRRPWPPSSEGCWSSRIPFSGDQLNFRTQDAPVTSNLNSRNGVSVSPGRICQETGLPW